MTLLWSLMDSPNNYSSNCEAPEKDKEPTVLGPKLVSVFPDRLIVNPIGKNTD